MNTAQNHGMATQRCFGQRCPGQRCFANPIVVALLVFVTTAITSGCVGTADAQLESYLNELEFETPLESVREVELGNYYITSPIRRPDPTAQAPQVVWVRVKFQLFAAVAPKDESAVKAALERHRGMMDDGVLSICRSVTIEELEDSRWSVLKARIIDLVRPLLGRNRVRQVMFDNFTWEPL